MTVEVEIPGVRLVRRKPADENATYPPETYFAINFAQISRGTLLGPGQEDFVVQDDGTRVILRYDWPWHWVAAWVLGKTQHGQPQASQEELVRWIDRVHRWFLAEPLNAKFYDVLDENLVPRHLPPDHPQDPGAEVVLLLNHELEGLTNFRGWYSRRLAQVKVETFERQTEKLRTTVGAAIAEANARHEKVQETEVEPLTRALTRLQIGDLTFQVMFDFAKPSEERSRMWGKAGGAEYVVPEPDGVRRRLVERLRSQWKEKLLRPCAELVSRAVPRALDGHAASVLRMLRDEHGPVLTMFRRWDSLCPAAQAELVETTLEGLRIGLMGATTRTSVIDGEFTAVAIAVSALGTPVGPSGSDERARALALAIEQFDPALVLPQGRQTPLAQFLASKFKSTREMSTHGAVALDVLTMAAPHIVRKLKTYNLTGALDSAWLWRATVGIGDLSPDVQKGFWRRLGGLIGEKKAPKGRGSLPVPLLELERGALSRAMQDSAAAWKTIAVLVDCLTVAEVAHQQRNESPDRALRELAAITGLMKNSMDLVTAQADFARLLDHTSERELEALSKQFGSTRAVPIVGLVADALAFAVSVRDAHAAQKKWSKKTRAQAMRNAFFDGLSLAATAVGLVIGSELVVLAMLIWGAKELLEDPDAWLPYLPFSGIARKPGPHRYLESLLKQLDDDDKVKAVLDKPRAGGLGSAFAAILNDYERSITEEDERELWDIGGAPGMHLDWPAKNILRDYYSFPPEARKVLVIASREGTQ